jgi:glycosyltransferase involved in cell wall biosynthesis
MSSRAQNRSTGIINFIHSVEKNHIAKNFIENKTRLHSTIINHLKSSLDTRLFDELVKNKNQISTIDKEAIKSAIAELSNIKNNKTKSNVSLLLFNFSLLSNDILEFDDLTEKVKEDNLQEIYRSIRKREVKKLQDYITDLYISLLFNLQNKKIQNSLAIKIELVGVIYFYISLISPTLENDFVSSTNEIIKSIKVIFKHVFHYNIDKDFSRIGVNGNLNELLEFNKAILMMEKIKKTEMSETYLNMVKYFVAQYKNLSTEQRSYLANDISNALKLSEDKALIDFISEHHFYLIKDLNLSPKQIDKMFSTNRSEEKYSINKFIFFDLHTEPSEALTYIKQSKKTSKELNYKTNILYCNLYAKKRFLSNVSYKHNLNEFLTGYGLPKAIDLNLKSDNILNSIKFEKQKIFKNGSKISVIMSAYNASETVEYAIRSLLNQTVDNIEILVCDDASDDDTLNKMLKLSKEKSQVRVFRSIKNQGTYNIRNNLIKKATGKYITFQDSDDYSLPNRLEKQVIELEKSDKIICFTQWVRIKKNGSFVFFHDDNVSRFCVVSAMLTKETFKKIPPFRKSLVAADTEFYQTIIKEYGRDKIHQIYAPYNFGLADECSLTNIKTLNAENSGFVAKRRRDYSDIAARQRILGKEIVTDQDVEKVLIDNKIYRTDHGVLEFIDGEWK